MGGQTGRMVGGRRGGAGRGRLGTPPSHTHTHSIAMQGSAVQCTTPTALSPEPPPPPPHPPTHQKQREAVCVGAAVGAVGRAVGAEQVVYKVVHSILGHAVRCDVEWRSWQSAEEAKWEQLVGGVWSEKCVGYVSVFSTSTAAAVAAAAGIPPSRHSPLAGGQQGVEGVARLPQ